MYHNGQKQNNISFLPLILLVFIVVLEWSGPLPAHALQAHGYKGLYVHQGAHLFFSLAMLSFIFRIRASGLINRKEWRHISHGAWLLMFWNIWAFAGHFIELYVPADHIRLLADDLVPSLAIASWKEITYFLLKMDHLISVPAITCFFLGIKTMLMNKEQQPS